MSTGVTYDIHSVHMKNTLVYMMYNVHVQLCTTWAYQFLSLLPDLLDGLPCVLGSLVHGKPLHHLFHYCVLQLLLLQSLSLCLSPDCPQFIALKCAILRGEGIEGQT